MKFPQSLAIRLSLLIILSITLVIGSTRLRADTGTCGGQMISVPFTDVMGNPFFCHIAAAYFSGLTNGTSATTYSPAAAVTREQMAAFVTRTQDSVLRRGSRRAAVGQWWTPQTPEALRSTDLSPSAGPADIACDGADLWVANAASGTVSRVRASDGKLLETWTGADGASGILVAAGRVFITGIQAAGMAGRVYVIDPTQPAGAVTLLKDNTGPNPYGITFDGVNLWTANAGSMTSGSVTRIPLTGGAETTFTTEFTQPYDILWDGENLWVADFGTELVKRIDPVSGVVLESIPVGTGPVGLLFDGVNLWVSVFFEDSLAAVRAAGNLRGRVLATLTGNGLIRPRGLAFDGERILTVNFGGPSASLFKAADFTPLSSLSVGAMAGSQHACSDGLNFWITRTNTNDIERF